MGESMDNADAIELAELEVSRLIEVCHKQLNYFEILKLFLIACQELQMLSEVEYQMGLKQNG